MSKDARMRLRGHHLLCVLGFRGRGYSGNFIDNMAKVVGGLANSPESILEVIMDPDDICMACRFLFESGCSKEGPSSEASVRNRDQRVMVRLGLLEREELPWQEVLRRIVSKIQPGELAELCQDCQWLPLGYCAEGLAKLRPGPSYLTKDKLEEH